MDDAHGSGARLVVVQLEHAPLPVAPAVGALSLAVAGAGGRPCEHAVQVPAVFVHEPGGASGHQQNGGHSSCMQILVRTVHTVQQTVFWGWLSCACCCAATGALVGARSKLWSSAVAVSLGLRNAWFDYGYMFAVSRVVFGRISTIFHVIGWTRILGSILVVHCTHGR